VAINPQEIAVKELASAGVPFPDDLLADVGPMGRVWYLHQCANEVLTSVTAMLSGDEAEDLGDTSDLAMALDGIVITCGNIAAVCVKLGLLDEAAVPPTMS